MKQSKASCMANYFDRKVYLQIDPISDLMHKFDETAILLSISMGN